MNSIQAEINGVTLANEIRMMKGNFQGAFLIVEGSSDAKLFTKFIDKAQCSISVGFGRPNVLEALSHFESDDLIFAICDCDYASLLGYPDYSGVAIFTDLNDMESDIFKSSAFPNVLYELGNEQKIEALKETCGHSLYELIFIQAAKIGVVRYLSLKNSWKIKFEGMTYKFLAANNFEISLEDTIHHLINRSSNYQGPSAADVLIAAADTISSVPSEKLVNGHDATRILGKAFKRSFGNNSSFDVSPPCKTLESILRLAFEWIIFEGSNVYLSVRCWERMNGHTILK